MPAQRCRHRDGRTQLRQLKAGRKAQQQHSSPGAVRLHSQNAHSSALLARWARPMCTAVTARSGAPFAQTVSLLQRTPASRRIPAPKGAITCSPAQRRKILSSASRGSNPRERRQQVNDIGARANGLLISMPAMLWAAAERGARGTVVAHGEPRTDRLFSVREVGGRGGRGRPGSHHISTVASVPSRVGCGSRSEAVERCVSSYCTCVRGHRSRSDPAKVVQWKNTHVQTASEHLPRPTPLRLLGPRARAQSTGRTPPPRPPTSLTEKRRSDRGSP